jgi:hypothetical protein
MCRGACASSAAFTQTLLLRWSQAGDIGTGSCCHSEEVLSRSAQLVPNDNHSAVDIEDFRKRSGKLVMQWLEQQQQRVLSLPASLTQLDLSKSSCDNKSTTAQLLSGLFPKLPISLLFKHHSCATHVRHMSSLASAASAAPIYLNSTYLTQKSTSAVARAQTSSPKWSSNNFRSQELASPAGTASCHALKRARLMPCTCCCSRSHWHRPRPAACSSCSCRSAA